MAERLNLAKRPFVNSRPANAAAVVLGVAALVLTGISVRTVERYLDGSKKTRERIATLRQEIAHATNQKRQASAALARFDLEELAAGIGDANQIAEKKAFSWTRFLTRLEETLPADQRVASIALTKKSSAGDANAALVDATTDVALVLVSRDPNGLPEAIRAFYASRWFDRPAPSSEDAPDRGTGDGRRLVLRVVYHDLGRPDWKPPEKPAAKVGAKERSKAPAAEKAERSGGRR